MTRIKSQAKKTGSSRRRCPACGLGWLVQTTTTDRFTHEEDGVSMSVVVEKVPIERCTKCKETFRGMGAARRHHQAICRTFGFLTPQEICELRECTLRLTQDEFARVTGIGVATISRWERGRLVQNRAMDRYLRLLRDSPASIRFLKNLSA